MLRVTVELVPWGMESLKSTMAEVIIANDSTGSDTSGNYDVFLNPVIHLTGISAATRTHIEGWPKNRDQRHVVGLAGEALQRIQQLRDIGEVRADEDWQLTDEQMDELRSNRY